MTEYLNFIFNDSPEFIDTYDEMPLWSAAFGLLMLEHIPLKPNLTVVDLGSGSGFPLLELAARLGNTSKLYGVDPWKNANIRAEKKIKNYGLTNVEILDCSAEQIPLAENSVDIVVSNLGLNNFDDPQKVLLECCRVLNQHGKIAITTNLNGHWKEFYDVFESTLIEMNKPELVEKLTIHQRHRGTTSSLKNLFEENGFSVYKCVERTMEMRFLDGTAFLNHYFVKLGWLSSWKSLLPDSELVEIFNLLEQNLNSYARPGGELKLSVPMLYIESEKISR